MSSSSGFGSGVFGSSGLGTNPFYNVSEIIDAILYTTGHGQPSTETTKRNAILYFINNRYQEICLGPYHWEWIEASYDFTLEDPYDTGTVSLIKGDASVAGTSTLWDANINVKDIFTVSGFNQVFHVSGVTSNTALSLETDYSEEDQTDVSYKIGKNQYKLPKETDKLNSFILDSQYKLVPVGVQDFRYIQSQNPTLFGRPEFYSMIRRDTDDDAVYVEVFPTPDKKYQCHIDYKVRIVKLEDLTTCYPIIPDRYRAVLYYGTLADYLNNYVGDAGRAQVAMNNFSKMYADMKNDKQVDSQVLQFIPSRKYFDRGRTQPVKRIASRSITAADFGKEG